MSQKDISSENQQEKEGPIESLLQPHKEQLYTDVTERNCKQKVDSFVFEPSTDSENSPFSAAAIDASYEKFTKELQEHIQKTSHVLSETRQLLLTYEEEKQLDTDLDNEFKLLNEPLTKRENFPLSLVEIRTRHKKLAKALIDRGTFLLSIHEMKVFYQKQIKEIEEILQMINQA